MIVEIASSQAPRNDGTSNINPLCFLVQPLFSFVVKNIEQGSTIFDLRSSGISNKD
jgi:hypothetical protein